MLQVGQPAPEFDMASTKDLTTLKERVKLSDYRGKWLVLFFYPLDFTFVCPTEVTGFSDRLSEFHDLNAEVIAVSTDSVFSHKAWIETPREKNGVSDLLFPLGSDITKSVSRDYGVLIERDGIALRGLFIIDPEGILQYQVVHSLNIGRNVDEAVRVLQGLQSGGRCPINWKPGQENI